MRSFCGYTAAAANLAKHAPDIIDHAEAARGLEQAANRSHVRLLRRIDCAKDLGKVAQSQRDHEAIPRSARSKCRSASLHPGTLPSDRRPGAHSAAPLPRPSGSESQEILLLRRMNLAHRALRAASPSTATVTEIATRFGFWELGGSRPSTASGVASRPRPACIEQSASGGFSRA